MDKTTDKIMQIKKLKYSLARNKFIASRENAEKVVKDPKRPIIKKNLIKFSDKLFPILDVIKYPIKKEPKILTKMVP